MPGTNAIDDCLAPFRRLLKWRLQASPLKGAGTWNDNLQPRRERLGYKKSTAKWVKIKHPQKRSFFRLARCSP
ncbi:MAG: hypothetical protein DMG06_26005 [Acidobacteria bacterium]|nr:MAG: hypothetical protein DMG06_26005 [Acidobacteriota bacterium]